MWQQATSGRVPTHKARRANTTPANHEGAVAGRQRAMHVCKGKNVGAETADDAWAWGHSGWEGEAVWEPNCCIGQCHSGS